MNLQRSTTYNKDINERKPYFSISTYNILADFHITDKGYPKQAGTEYLYRKDDTSFRHQLLLKEIDFLSSDIILLQEIDTWYVPILSKELESRDYHMMFWCKQQPDLEGNAICFNSKRFQLIDSYQGHFNDDLKVLAEMKRIDLQSLDDNVWKTHGYQICALNDQEYNKTVVIGTTHIVWEGAQQPGLQTLHASILCKQTQAMRSQVAATRNISVNGIPVVIGGDFNSEPDWMLVSLMTNGSLSDGEKETLKYLNCTNQMLKPKKSEKACSAIEHFSDELHHSLNLSKAYDGHFGKNLKITSADDTYNGVLDYLFFSSENLTLHSILNVDDDVAEQFSNGGPSELFSSDHLALKASFGYK